MEGKCSRNYPSSVEQNLSGPGKVLFFTWSYLSLNLIEILCSLPVTGVEKALGNEMLNEQWKRSQIGPFGKYFLALWKRHGWRNIPFIIHWTLPIYGGWWCLESGSHFVTLRTAGQWHRWPLQDGITEVWEQAGPWRMLPCCEIKQLHSQK